MERQDVADVVTSSDGVPIAYEVHGQGTPALVFVHGWSCDRTYWEGQLHPLSLRFRVVAVDLAGHGESGLARGKWTIRAFGEDVAAVVDKLELGRVILIGHSMGGDVILEAARRLPGRVAGLVWVDTYRELGTPVANEELEAFWAPFDADFVEATRAFVRGTFPPDADSALVERVAADMSAAPPAIALQTIRSATSFYSEVPSVLRELTLPLVAINPDHKSTDMESMGRHGIEVVLMSGAGHFLMMEDPQRFNRLLETVIDKLAREP
jgi:pimeloyl-ACP methyl ester carboxylesterase